MIMYISRLGITVSIFRNARCTTPQILADQKTVAAVPARRITTHPPPQIFRPSAVPAIVCKY